MTPMLLYAILKNCGMLSVPGVVKTFFRIPKRIFDLKNEFLWPRDAPFMLMDWEGLVRQKFETKIVILFNCLEKWKELVTYQSFRENYAY